MQYQVWVVGVTLHWHCPGSYPDKFHGNTGTRMVTRRPDPSTSSGLSGLAALFILWLTTAGRKISSEGGGRPGLEEIISLFYISSQAFHTTQDDLLLISRAAQKNIRKQQQKIPLG